MKRSDSVLHQIWMFQCGISLLVVIDPAGRYIAQLARSKFFRPKVFELAYYLSENNSCLIYIPKITHCFTVFFFFFYLQDKRKHELFFKNELWNFWSGRRCVGFWKVGVFNKPLLAKKMLGESFIMRKLWWLESASCIYFIECDIYALCGSRFLFISRSLSWGRDKFWCGLCSGLITGKRWST